MFGVFRKIPLCCYPGVTPKQHRRSVAEKLDFTNRAIEAIQAPPEGRLELKDTKVAGLYLRVTPNGVKTFSYVGRPKGSTRVERLTLGKFPAVKPEEARRRAVQLAGELAGGKSVAVAARERRGEPTLDELHTEYMAHLRAHRMAPDQAERLYRLYLKPYFGTRRISEIRSQDIAKWHRNLPNDILSRREQEAAARRARDDERRRQIVERQAIRRHGPDPKPKRVHLSAGRVSGKTTANRAYDSLRAMFNYAKGPDARLFAGENPAKGVTRFDQLDRERFLHPGELKPFFEALAAEPNITMRDCLLLKLLTGARSANVHAMKWSDVHLDRAEWRIPKTKNGQPQTVALVPEAVAMLREHSASPSRYLCSPPRAASQGTS